MKTLTVKGKRDGFGAQYQAIMSGIAYCNYMNYKYIHTPFKDIAHDEDSEKLNEFIGIPVSNEKNIDFVVNYCRDVHISKTPDIYYNSDVIKILQEYYYSTPKPNVVVPDIAIHIRRGDVKKQNKKRYTPDNKYKEILTFFLEKYPNKKITIFSEGTLDSFKNLQHHNVDFKLNTSTEETFHALVSAKILVTAKSSFSYCAALLNKNEIFYIPFWHEPLKKWNIL